MKYSRGTEEDLELQHATLPPKKSILTHIFSTIASDLLFGFLLGIVYFLPRPNIYIVAISFSLESNNNNNNKTASFSAHSSCLLAIGYLSLLIPL